jgi:mono/diheme cytochrome c family protein
MKRRFRGAEGLIKKLSMTRITISAFIATALIVLGTKLGEVDPDAFAQGSSRQELLIGQRIYEANCAVCHGQRGDGRGWLRTCWLRNPGISVGDCSSFASRLQRRSPRMTIF